MQPYFTQKKILYTKIKQNNKSKIKYVPLNLSKTLSSMAKQKSTCHGYGSATHKLKWSKVKMCMKEERKVCINLEEKKDIVDKKNMHNKTK